MHKTPDTTEPSIHTKLQALGTYIRAHRKTLRISATATAEAAGISRVTLHRIEKGESTVAVGAYNRTLSVLGLEMHIAPPTPTKASTTPAGWIPARIALDDYPQLKRLAWHVQGTQTLSPMEALDIYERNARHLDEQDMSPDEQNLLQSLRQAFSDGPSDV